MTAREYLEQIEIYDARIRNNKRLLSWLDNLNDRVHVQMNGHIAAMIGESIHTRMNRLDERIRKQTQARERIVENIYHLGCGLRTDVLIRRYSCGESWDEIGKLLYINPRYAQQIARDGLIEFYEEYADELNLSGYGDKSTR